VDELRAFITESGEKCTDMEGVVASITCHIHDLVVSTEGCEEGGDIKEVE